jgi:ketosteroid isomerase-like protein
MTQDIATTHPVFHRQLDALAAGDVDAVLANYAPDAALLRFDGVATGLDELRATFTGYLSLRPRLLELTQYAENADTIFYRAVMSVGGRPEQATGTMVLRDGKIWRQTAAFG